MKTDKTKRRNSFIVSNELSLEEKREKKKFDPMKKKIVFLLNR